MTTLEITNQLAQLAIEITNRYNELRAQIPESGIAFDLDKTLEFDIETDRGTGVLIAINPDGIEIETQDGTVSNLGLHNIYTITDRLAVLSKLECEIMRMKSPELPEKYFAVKDADDGEIIALVGVKTVNELIPKLELAVLEEVCADSAKLIGSLVTNQEDRELWATLPTKNRDIQFDIHDDGTDYIRSFELVPVPLY